MAGHFSILPCTPISLPEVGLPMVSLGNTEAATTIIIDLGVCVCGGGGNY